MLNIGFLCFEYVDAIREKFYFSASIWRKNKSARRHRLLCEAYGDNAPSISTDEYWFRRFKNSDFDTKDKKREGRPETFEDEELSN